MRYLATIFICCGFSVFAQQPQTRVEKTSPPDYKAIAKETANSTSRFYYPKLLKRYEAGDTTLTTEDYRYLYFGYLFQPGYDPTGGCSADESLKNFYEKNIPSSIDRPAVIEKATACLRENPFSIRELSVLGYAWQYERNRKEMDACFMKVEALTRAILSTGDGKTTRTAWHVIDRNHEYEIVLSLGYVPEERVLIKNRYDVISVEENPYLTVPVFYFNASQIVQDSRLR